MNCLRAIVQILKDKYREIKTRLNQITEKI